MKSTTRIKTLIKDPVGFAFLGDLEDWKKRQGQSLYLQLYQKKKNPTYEGLLDKQDIMTMRDCNFYKH